MYLYLFSFRFVKILKLLALFLEMTKIIDAKKMDYFDYSGLNGVI